ncbi:hypothetical protein K432DRAFT_310594, partial [Lepidopterella palustris CBS 459.81]
IGSGIATSFPFHATGSDFKNALENSLDIVVSSYTPTIKALKYLRQNGSSTKVNSILVITMPTTPGQIDLSSVEKEKDAIKFICKDICPFKELRLPIVEKVVERIPYATIIHFTYYKVLNWVNFFKSHLLLQKTIELEPMVNKLTVLRILAVQTQYKLKIIFLSTCSTA